ncbi:MAG: hypothetical protein F4X98_09060 [Gammaproteobacteria bacterium]|nr:hypothetical protein [Gammaproteobacteria bacterium]
MRFAPSRAIPAWIGLQAALGWPAAGSVCTAGDPQEVLLVEWNRAGRSALDVRDPVSVQMTGTALRARLWRRSDEPSRGAQRMLRFLHDYRAYDIPAVGEPLETNGHLHRLGVSFHERRDSWEWAVAPFLAASSNVGRQPRVIDGDVVAWHGMVRRMHRLDTAVTAYWGACRDDRLGERRLLPVVGFQWRLDHLDLTLGFPDSVLNWRAHERWSVQLRVQPAGGSWRVFSDDLERRSRFRHAGWRLGVGVGFELTANHRLTASAAREVRQSFRFRLDDGSDVRADAPDTWLVGLRLAWLR